MKRCAPIFLFGIVLMLTILLWGIATASAMETTVGQILADSDSFDGQEVSVAGTVSNLKFRTLKDQRPCTLFVLVGEGGRINVFMVGRLKLNPGQSVKVTGVYRKMVTISHRLYQNEIEASEIR